jgi:hypothetical protein
MRLKFEPFGRVRSWRGAGKPRNTAGTITGNGIELRTRYHMDTGLDRYWVAPGEESGITLILILEKEIVIVGSG